MNKDSSTFGQMDMGDIVAGAFGLFRRSPLPWLALTLAGALIVFAAQWAFADDLNLGADPTEEQVRAAIPTTSGFLAISSVAQLFAHVALVAGAVAVLSGAGLSIARAYAAGARAFLSVLAATLITALVAVLFVLSIIGIPVAIYFFIRWSMAGQVIVAERTGPLRALGRSHEVVRGQWWRTLGITLAIMLLSFLPVFVIGLLTASRADWLAAAGGAAGGALVAPFIALAQTLLYADLRARKGERPFSPRPKEVAA